MEAKLLAGVTQTDTHKRLQVADDLTDFFKNNDQGIEEFQELDRLVSGLAVWMGSSNFKVSGSSMEIFTLIASKTKGSFKQHIPTIFPHLREKLGDAKEQVREQAQTLIQQIQMDVVSAPQGFLDKLMETCLVHKNWRVKEQGLLCVSRTLNYFGSGQISVSRHMSEICNLLSDANSQVRSCAMETLVDIYRHVGVKVRIDLSRRNLPSSRMSQLTARFDAVDATTGSTETTETGVHALDVDVDDDRASLNSAGSSNVSARTLGSTHSTGGRSRPPPTAASKGGSGAVSEEDFTKSFEDAPSMNLFTLHDVEKAAAAITATLIDTRKPWETRITALKQLRTVVKNETSDHTHILSLIRSMDEAMVLSLKDLRSQVVREASITLSLMATLFTSEFSFFAELMLPQLIALLSNSAKVMASSAEVCLKMIVKYSPNYRLLNPLSTIGLASKSPVIRRHCSEVFGLILSWWSTAVLERKGIPIVESMLKKGLLDQDSITRKNSRQAFWLYNTHLPNNASRMLDSFDPQLQKHINDAKGDGGRSITLPPSGTKYSSMSLPRPKKKPLAHAASEEVFHRPTSPPTASHVPSVRLIRPTIRSPRRAESSKVLRSASSMENMIDKDGTSTSPIPRPPSRTEVHRSNVRPASRTGVRGGLEKRSSGHDLKRPASRSGRLSRSCQPSPAVSRDTSPTGLRGVTNSSSGKQKLGDSLTTEDMMKLYGYGKGNKDRDDDEDAGSVSSERSSYSISSEVSVNPYARYTQPVTDLNDLVSLCMSSSWSERKDGIAQLHMLLDSTIPFSHSDMQRVRAVFKQMFAEPHAKVFSMFLDTLAKFIEEHREYLDDWLYIMLLRLIHRQGSDMLTSVHFKLQLVLEQIRKSFDPDVQFSNMCRLVSDQSQPMNSKVKVAWLEYFLELLPSVEGSDFKDNTVMRQALPKLIEYTTEPKSAEVRRQSQKVLTRLFDLNPATLSLMLNALPRILQESANRILQCYVADMSSSGEESDREKSTSPKKTSPAQRKPPRTPLSNSPRSRPKTPSSGSRPKTPSSGSRLNPVASLPPSAIRSLGGARTISSSTPNMTSPGTRSRIPTPGKRGTGIRTPKGTPPRRPMSTTPGSAPSTGRMRRVIPPRAQSVGPEKLADQLAAKMAQERPRINRAGSSMSEYSPSQYQNGRTEVHASPSNSLEQFSLSDLPHLDFGEDQGNDDYLHRDKMAVLVRELTTAKNSKLRNAALETLYTQARESPESCSWGEHFQTVLLRLLELLSDEESNVRAMCLRVFREMLKSNGDKLKDYAELATIKVLKGFSDSDSLVSQAAEDTFEFLAPALPFESTVCLLYPMVAQEKYPMLLGTIKLFTKVINCGDSDYLRSKLPEIIPGLIRGYCHTESSVRKVSVFCLVAVQASVGDTIKEYLTKLSSSQSKLLDLYIKRAQQESSSNKKN
ncbi:CLIP-associating protein 1-B-like [Halichondria panicea]|uniref:CLIP-associating protein 1-B-like n=1 Tax=Halichondria panicea TaxID=6063 RepID=UPI00312B9EFD